MKEGRKEGSKEGRNVDKGRNDILLGRGINNSKIHWPYDKTAQGVKWRAFIRDFELRQTKAIVKLTTPVSYYTVTFTLTVLEGTVGCG